MNWLSLKNNWLKFNPLRKLLLPLKAILTNVPQSNKEKNEKSSSQNMLVLKTPGSQPYKVKPPKTNNTHRKTNTMYHMHTSGASNCMHVVHSVVGFVMGVDFGWFLPDAQKNMSPDTGFKLKSTERNGLQWPQL